MIGDDEAVPKGPVVFSSLLHIPIIAPSVLVPVYVLAAVATIVMLLDLGLDRRLLSARDRASARRVRFRRLRAMLIAGAAGAAIGLVAIWWIGDVQDAFGVAFTGVERMWIAFAFAAAAMVIVALVQGGGRRRVVAFTAMASVALAAGLGINVDFGAYRTLQQALMINPYPTVGLASQHPADVGAKLVDAATWTPPTGMPKHGMITRLSIPGIVSGFHARDAVVYLPPAARVADPPVLPVIISLSGQPGQPSDMFQSGQLGRQLDRYAAHHDGLAPIVVAPDQLGAPNRNPMCVNSRALGNSGTYITTDVVHWIKHHLNVAPSPDSWGLVGFSEGATCAVQFISGDPHDFGSALAIASELQQQDGSVRQTVNAAYGGSMRRYLDATPIAMMREHQPFTDHLIVFTYGQNDHRYRKSTLALQHAARAAGIRTSTLVSPHTAHDWFTVRYSIDHGLLQVIAHEGLPR